MRYYKLTDKLNNGEVIKEDNDNSYRYYFGTEKWIKTGIMIEYQWPEDELFGKYTEISESEAKQFLNMQRNKLNELYELAKQISKKNRTGQAGKDENLYVNHPMNPANSLENTEHKIVALLYNIFEDKGVTVDDMRSYGFTDRIINSICILTKKNSMSYEKYLASVKTDSNACAVKMADLKHRIDVCKIPDPSEKDLEQIEKYKKALQFLEN
ncbi:hypothetical protein LJC24_00570 [Desulfococcaceae bacterium OttesenSCG-928-F15]|nr:hypothetical protein [Desulfococcaceae bacterium OttesenSCG-928-F15]